MAPLIVPVTVTVVAPAFSVTVVGLTERSMDDGAASSSVRLNVALPDTKELVLDTVMVSLVSSSESFVGVSVKVAVPDDAFALIVRLKSDTAAKSTAEAVPEPVTLIGITVFVVYDWEMIVPVTVTVVAPAFSVTVVGLTDKLMFGGKSLSVSVSVVELTCLPKVVQPDILMVSSVSFTESSVGVSVKVLV